MDNQTFLLLYAAKILKEYCKNHTESCNICPFYVKDYRWTSCMFESDVSAGWDMLDTIEENYMTKRDIEAIKHVKAIREYCHECNDCRSCVFRTGNINGNLIEDACMFEDDRIPEDWELPIAKTYKQDFLEKFPNAKFDAENICRNNVYPNAGKHLNCNTRGTCKKCWDKVYVAE